MADKLALDDTGPIDLIDVEGIARAIRPHVRPTLLFAAEALSERLGAEVRLASETLQHTGSFKIRAATAVALNTASPHLLAASSGNFGAALALAARRAGKRCTVVMPAQSAQVKIAAVRRHGAEVDLVDTTKQSRLERLAALAQTLPEAQVVSAYDDPFVIGGNASLGLEIFESMAPVDVVVAPVGGGGLSSGIVLARDKRATGCAIVGAEPALANDAARSLRAGLLVRDAQESQTICDGARTLALGQRNFAVLRRGLAGIVEASEPHVAEAVQLLFELANLKVEPTGALSVAALLADPGRFAGKRVTCIVSGGNVDAHLYAHLLRS